MKLTIPELSLVVLVGPSGCGKSTFARTHFAPFEVLSSDFCRGLVSNNENDQSATGPAFEVLHFVAARRLAPVGPEDEEVGAPTQMGIFRRTDRTDHPDPA